MTIKTISPTSANVDIIKDRGSFQTSMYFSNRLGYPIGVKQRNGVNVILPAAGAGQVDGTLSIYVEYRCQGKAQLNHLFSAARDGQYEVKQIENPKNKDRSVLYLEYVIAHAELSASNKNQFYIDVLDVMISSDPAKEGIRDHDEQPFIMEMRDQFKGATAGLTMQYIRANSNCRFGRIQQGDYEVSLPVVKNEVDAPILVTARFENKELVEEIALLGKQDVAFADEYIERELILDAFEEVDLEYQGDYFNHMDKIQSSDSSMQKDLSKAVSDAAITAEKIRELRRLAEISEIKQSSSTVNESVKAVSAACSTFIKLLG